MLFRLHESPRFLVSSGRGKEAVVVLQAIADFNDQDMEIDHNDVRPSQAAAGESAMSAMSTMSEVEEARALIPSSEDPGHSPPASPMAPMSPLSSRSPLTRRSSSNARGGRSKPKLAWLHDWRKQMAKLFSPRWRRTVILMWIIWGLMAFGKLAPICPADSSVHNVQRVASERPREP